MICAISHPITHTHDLYLLWVEHKYITYRILVPEGEEGKSALRKEDKHKEKKVWFF